MHTAPARFSQRRQEEYSRRRTFLAGSASQGKLPLRLEKLFLCREANVKCQFVGAVGVSCAPRCLFCGFQVWEMAEALRFGFA